MWGLCCCCRTAAFRLCYLDNVTAAGTAAAAAAATHRTGRRKSNYPPFNVWEFFVALLLPRLWLELGLGANLAGEGGGGCSHCHLFTRASVCPLHVAEYVFFFFYDLLFDLFQILPLQNKTRKKKRQQHTVYLPRP